MKFRKIEQGSKEGAGKFLKIGNGESVKGICVGELYEYNVKWIDGKSHVVPKGTPGAKSRFRMNFATRDDKQKLVAKIFEFGVQINNQLYEIAQEYDLSQTVIKISRHGEKLETEYTVLPLLKDIVPKVELQNLELNILEHKEAPSAPAEDIPWGDEPAPGDVEDSEELPF